MVGKYELEALTQRREYLMDLRGRRGLTPGEGKELDEIVSKIGERDHASSFDSRIQESLRRGNM